MITKEQRTRILSLVENCCVYEGQVVLFEHLKRKENDPECAGPATYSYNRAFQNADEAGQAFIKYLDSLVEDSNEVI